MLPCSKIITDSYSARWIKHAEGMARSITMNSGIKNKIIDGCIVQGKRSGRNLRASVIEPKGRIAFVGGGFDGKGIVSVSDCVNRSDLNSISENRGITISGEYKPKTLTYFFGLPPAGGFFNEGIGYSYSSASDRSIYSADIFDESGSRWLRVIASPVGAEDVTRSVIISDKHIGILAPGYSLKTSTANDNSNTNNPVVTAYGKVIYIAVTVSKAIDYIDVHGYDAPVINQEILLLKFDLKEIKLTARRLNHEAFSDELSPTIISEHLRTSQTTTIYPARSPVILFFINDIYADEEAVHVAFKYVFEYMDGPDQSIAEPFPMYSDDRFASIVYCACSAKFKEYSKSVIVHNVQVDAVKNTQSLVDLAKYGVDPIAHKNHMQISMRKKDCLYSLYTFARPNPTGNITSLGPNPIAYRRDWNFYRASPYCELALNDNVISNATEGLFSDFYRYSLSGSANYYISRYAYIMFDSQRGKANSCMVSDDVICLYRSSPDVDDSQKYSTGGGLLFTDGTRFKYEPIDGLVDLDGYSSRLFVSCPQIEKRSPNGKLKIPATIVLSTKINSDPVIGLRKGPIWDEDKIEKMPAMSYVFSASSDDRNLKTAFFTGNALMLNDYGHLME